MRIGDLLLGVMLIVCGIITLVLALDTDLARELGEAIVQGMR